MNAIKIIFICMETAMIVGFLSIIFFADTSVLEFKLLASLMALNAIVFQKEQQGIEWNLDEEY